MAEELSRIDIPTIALDIFDESILGGRRKNLVYIGGLCKDIGQTAARHFLSQGLYRSYAFVPDLAGHTWSRLRGEAFIAEMAHNGFKTAVYRTRGKGYDLPKLRAWINKLPRPVGIFAAFDDRAIQVLEACRDAGLDVPHQVAVIGVDNDEMICPHTTPPLTSVQPDHTRIGELAAEKLMEMMDGRRSTHPERILVGVKRKRIGHEDDVARPVAFQHRARLKRELPGRFIEVKDGKRVLAAVRDDDSTHIGREADCRRLTIFERFCRIKIAIAAWSFGVLENCSRCHILQNSKTPGSESNKG